MGVEARARSGRRKVTKEPRLEIIVGGVSSDTSRYALNASARQVSSWTSTGCQQVPHFIVAAAAKPAAQQTFRMNSLSCVSAMRCGYGLSFAASDLWKFASNASSSSASNAYLSVSGDLVIYQNLSFFRIPNGLHARTETMAGNRFVRRKYAPGLSWLMPHMKTTASCKTSWRRRA